MKESVRCFVASGEHSGIRSKNSRHTISLLVTNPRITEKECSVKYFYFYKNGIVLSGEIWYVRNNRTLKNSDLNMENEGMTLQETMENEFSKLRKTSHIFHIVSCYTEYDRTVRGGGR